MKTGRVESILRALPHIPPRASSCEWKRIETMPKAFTEDTESMIVSAGIKPGWLAGVALSSVAEFMGRNMDPSVERFSQTQLETAFDAIHRLTDRSRGECLGLRGQSNAVSMSNEIVGSSPALKAAFDSV